MTNEELAIAVGNDRKELRKRLMEARSVLNGRYHKFFQHKHLRFDFEHKRLLGFDGWFLQWQIRLDPKSPESYENQQTSIGAVTLHNL